MRYRLSTLLLAFAGFGILLSLTLRFQWLSLIFIWPHAVAAVTVLGLTRHGRTRAAITTAACYFGVWIATAVIGTRDVHRHLDQKFAVARVYYSGELMPLRPMNYDPMYANEKTPRGAWYFAGQPSSPCPFVVSMRYSWEAGCMYDYGESYYLWICGAKRKVAARYANGIYATYPE